MSIDALEKHYINLVNPSNFIKIFRDLDEFREWANIGNSEDLTWAIKNFESEELYEYCAILKNVRDKKLAEEKEELHNG